MSGVWEGGVCPGVAAMQHMLTKYKWLEQDRPHRVVIGEDDYFIKQDTWGSAVLPKHRLTVTLSDPSTFEPGWRQTSGRAPMNSDATVFKMSFEEES